IPGVSMAQFQLFDQVQLLEPISLSGDFRNALEPKDTAPVETVGTVVEILEPGQAFRVELFGNWVKLQEPEGLCRSTAQEEGAFRETLGVEVVHPQQMVLLQRSNAVKIDLFQLLDDMPEELLAEVQTFAEFLRYRRQQVNEPVGSSRKAG
ncbi:MAG: hypothetical protein AAF329_21400, partial [Cyanobacteria bacterium P01_A01_bin.17]